MAIGNPANNPLKAHSLQTGLGFAALFTIAITLTAGMMTPLYRPAQNLTIATTTALGNLLGLTMTSNGDILTVNGFAMQIIGECTALNYVVILTLAILLYTRHSILYRMSGIAVAAGIILFVNAIRLIVTGLAGTVSLRLFLFVHEYLWVALFALLVFAIWKVWADRKFRITRESVQKTALTACSCTAMFLLLVQFKELHCQLLSALAAPLFRFLLGDPLATLVWDGELIYRQGETTLRMGMFFEMANLAVYTGLLLPYLWRNRKAIPFALFGLTVLVVMYAEFIAMTGVNGINYGYAAANTFQIVGNGIFLALPMALYWIVTGTTKNENA